ncbi:hypothetical protein BSKO_01629 [Bryopsis sp. KO-2023]|nr:hypothetical protein BSKO_01629 [Bryopsis sp. KO-2023]
MGPLSDSPASFINYGSKGAGFSKSAAFTNYWRIPFSRYACCPPKENLSEIEQKAIRALKDLSAEIKNRPAGLLERKISQCICLTHGSEQMHIAYLLSNLGCELCGIDYQPEAEIVHRRALCMGMRNLGENDPQLAPALDWLGFSLFRQGNHKETVLLCYSSMFLTVKHVGTWHPNTANCYSNLATVLDAMGQSFHAESLRCAGRTIFSCAGDPNLLRCWQSHYRLRGIIPGGSPVSHGEECGFSSSGISSGVSSHINGIINDIVVEMELKERANSCDSPEMGNEQLHQKQQSIGRQSGDTATIYTDTKLDGEGSKEAANLQLPSVLGDGYDCMSEGNKKNKERKGFASSAPKAACGRNEVLPICKKSKGTKVGINERGGRSKDERIQGSNGSEGSEEDFKIGVGLTEMHPRSIARV